MLRRKCTALCWMINKGRLNLVRDKLLINRIFFCRVRQSQAKTQGCPQAPEWEHALLQHSTWGENPFFWTLRQSLAGRRTPGAGAEKTRGSGVRTKPTIFAAEVRGAQENCTIQTLCKHKWKPSSQESSGDRGGRYRKNHPGAEDAVRLWGKQGQSCIWLHHPHDI